MSTLPKKLTPEERDAIDQNYPIHCDIVRIVQGMIERGAYPMDNQLHNFITILCDECGWPVDYTFKRIFKETPKEG